jgi:serine/threonine protein kinase
MIGFIILNTFTSNILIHCPEINKPNRALKDLLFKLADFGLAKEFGESLNRNTTVGTKHYAEPERVLKKGYDISGSDIWSLGAIIYEMLTGFDNLLFSVHFSPYSSSTVKC